MAKRKNGFMWLDLALNLFFPKHCVFCGELLPISQRRAVCSVCMKSLPFSLDGNRCEICGKPIEQGDRYCDACAPWKRRPSFRMTAAYRYEGLPKQSLLRFKGERHESYAITYAEHMQSMVLYDFPKVEFDMIVSVPPRLGRIRNEGYDQAETLGRALGKQLGIPYKPRVLFQKEERRKQSSLSAEERYANVCDNFRSRRADMIKDKLILLVDDICTTGATLQECAKTLKRYGATDVYCVTAATTARQGSGEEG